MANADKPMGFIPYKQINGGDPVAVPVDILSTNVAIGLHDVVSFTSSGAADRFTASDRTGYGIALESKAANAGGTLMVCPLEGHMFICQADENHVNALTELGKCYDIVATAPSNGLSQMELDSSTGATTATLPLKAIKKYDGFANTNIYPNDYGANVKLVVVFNETFFKGGSVGI